MPMARNAEWQGWAHAYQRHQPEHTRLYYIVEHHYPKFVAHLTEQGRSLPAYIEQEFEDYLKCGRLEHGFLRVRCEHCHHERLVAFSCKRRGFCPSCGARRMADSAALLVDKILPTQPMRQWVLTFPYQLRFLLARYPIVLSQVLGIVYRTLSTHLIKKAGFTHQTARSGAVTLIQRFGSALNSTDQQYPSVSSQNKNLKANADGSMDVWFAPKAPAGMENNWIQTIPGKGWFMIFRLNGPLEPWFDKTWRPGAIELQK